MATRKVKYSKAKESEKMKGICRLCAPMRKVTINRSAHLRQEHGIESYKGAVEEYFVRPEELGLTQAKFDSIPEGGEIVASRE